MTEANPKTYNSNSIIIAIIATAIIIGGAIIFTGKGNSGSSDAKPEEQIVNNVTIIDGKQIIELRAKGGFNPTHSVAKSGVPTILRLNTQGTFDCSSSIRIPALNISQ